MNRRCVICRKLHGTPSIASIPKSEPEPSARSCSATFPKSTDAHDTQGGQDEVGNGDFTLGPGPLGSFFIFSPDSTYLSPGTRFAPWAARAFGLADRELGTGIGAVESAPDVRAQLGAGDPVGDNPENPTGS